jgi:putative spermidine/putrescine transport system substrate-binding protein
MRRVSYYPVVVALAVLALLVPACTGGQVTQPTAAATPVATTGAPTPLIVYGQSGSLDEVMRAQIIPGFEKQFNAKVTHVGGTAADNLAKAKAEQNNPQGDVVISNDQSAVLGKRLGLWEKLDPALVPNLADVYEQVKDPQGFFVSQGIAPVVIAYNTKVFQERNFPKPTSWYDLWKAEYKGHVVPHTITNGFGVGFFVGVTKNLGGSESSVDVGFTKFKELAPVVLNWARTSTDFDTPMQQGTGWIGQNGNTRVNILIDKGVPLEIVYPKEGAVLINAQISVVKNAPHAKLAQQFVNYLLSPDVQKIICTTQWYGPSIKSLKLDDAVAKRVPYGQEAISKLVPLNWELMADNIAAWTERWNKEIEIVK